MSYRIINNIFDTTVAAITHMPTIVKENDEATRIPDATSSVMSDPYARTTLLPVETETATIGPGGHDRYNGLYQIDLFFPPNDGVNGTNYMVDAIIAAFPKGALIIQDGVQLRIDNYWREVSFQHTNWYITPVIIQWSCYIQRQ